MSAIQTSPFNLFPTAPEYRVYRLRCRFVVDAYPSDEQIDAERLKASYAFTEEMTRQGWTLTDGRLPITGGPFPATVVGVSDPRPILHAPARRGPHSQAVQTYDSPVREAPSLWNTSDWEYEISGLFVRKLMPTVATVGAIAALESRRKGH